MAALLIGYARCSTDQQDLTAQRDGLTSLGVEPGRIYVDHGLTGTNRERPGLSGLVRKSVGGQPFPSPFSARWMVQAVSRASCGVPVGRPVRRTASS